ncbi:MAG: prolipoprotein diacylglyceryl transferase family protein [Myxococcota bacterium]|nr:prolipoprotein diacylglyceryl transferase family protein [Myxococcota bacterium]
MIPALIPYWQPQVYHLGPIPIDPWATLVCVAFIVGLEVGRSRGIRKGIAPRDVVDGAVFVVLMGFVVGHLVHVLAYNQHLMQKDGVFDLWTAVKALGAVWAGFSSNGGFLGAVIGAVLFYKVIRPRPFWKLADNAMYGFPFGYIFGRLGCFTVHDHIGVKASEFPALSFLAVDFPAPYQPRYDLGGLEALWLVVVAAIFFAVDRLWPKGPDGKFIALWGFLYAPIRFLLDFLRNTDLGTADVRYLGLTPAQYGSLLTMFGSAAVLIWLVRKQKRQESQETTTPQQEPADGTG